MISSLLAKDVGEEGETGIVRVSVDNEADRALFEKWGIDPNQAFVFGLRSLAAVAGWLEDKEYPLSWIRVNPFGGYAVAFPDRDAAFEFAVWSMRPK